MQHTRTHLPLIRACHLHPCCVHLVQLLQAVCSTCQQQHLGHALVCLQVPGHQERPCCSTASPWRPLVSHVLVCWGCLWPLRKLREGLDGSVYVLQQQQQHGTHAVSACHWW